MRKYYVLIGVIAIVLFIFYQLNQRVITTIQYFPPDETGSIEMAKTELIKSNQANKVIWGVRSTSNDANYLRQDISLLFANGMFKGVLNQWEQHTDNIKIEKHFNIQYDTLLESISFHHGEIHDKSDQITSIQKMTNATLRIYPKAKKEKDSTLPYLIKQQLSNHWDKLLKHYQLSKKDYELIPLVDLINYDNMPLPNRSQSETEKIIGQLWEGIYKNYFTSLTAYPDTIPSHWMPIVLLAKDETHIMVLYEIDGEQHQLIQETK